ncbi:MAG: Integral rane protein [Frankiales bacterium]|nr:Integral rane protein [Frankiales bacterium]
MHGGYPRGYGRTVNTPVRRAALLVAAEGVGLVGVGLAYAVAGLLGQPEDRLGTELGAAIAVVVGVLLLLVARALDARRAWARSPAVVVQLFALPVGYGLAQGRVWVAAAVVLGLAVAVLLQLASPEARLAFDGRRGPGER